MKTVVDPPTPAGKSAAPDVRAFPGVPESVSEARTWAASFLPPGAAVADDVVLMTSELVTNAIQHSGSGLPGGVVLVSVTTGKTWVRVDVFDQGELPASTGAPPGLGMGLEIVAQLADVSGGDGSDRWFSVCTGGAR